jgi:hypothetical protein
MEPNNEGGVCSGVDIEVGMKLAAKSNAGVLDGA